MYDIPNEISILHDRGRGLYAQVEAEAPLVAFAARLHADFHDALAHSGCVTEFGDVADRIYQWVPRLA
jgi:hypothetical protein